VRYNRLTDFLWIPAVMLFLYPVFRYGGSHVSVSDSHVIQGPLFSGRQALDSLLSVNCGKPVIVNFWATWCTPCVGELPHIDEVYTSMEGSVAAIAVDIGDPELETLMGFRENFLLAMPVVWLNQGEAEQLKAEWSISDVLPVTVVFDSEGVEIERVAGVRDESFFRNAAEEGYAPDTAAAVVIEEMTLHINVVGPEDDSLTAALILESTILAGEEGVDFFDPSVPEDSLRMDELYLPNPGYPYAQACIGSACGPPAATPDELRQMVENLSN
jgi:thiol-disulfide isomerase/thioredoxin